MEPKLSASHDEAVPALPGLFPEESTTPQAVTKGGPKRKRRGTHKKGGSGPAETGGSGPAETCGPESRPLSLETIAVPPAATRHSGDFDGIQPYAHGFAGQSDVDITPIHAGASPALTVFRNSFAPCQPGQSSTGEFSSPDASSEPLKRRPWQGVPYTAASLTNALAGASPASLTPDSLCEVTSGIALMQRQGVRPSSTRSTLTSTEATSGSLAPPPRELLVSSPVCAVSAPDGVPTQQDVWRLLSEVRTLLAPHNSHRHKGAVFQSCKGPARERVEALEAVLRSLLGSGGGGGVTQLLHPLAAPHASGAAGAAVAVYPGSVAASVPGLRAQGGESSLSAELEATRTHLAATQAALAAAQAELAAVRRKAPAASAWAASLSAPAPSGPLQPLPAHDIWEGRYAAPAPLLSAPPPPLHLRQPQGSAAPPPDRGLPQAGQALPAPAAAAPRVGLSTPLERSPLTAVSRGGIWSMDVDVQRMPQPWGAVQDALAPTGCAVSLLAQPSSLPVLPLPAHPVTAVARRSAGAPEPDSDEDAESEDGGCGGTAALSSVAAVLSSTASDGASGTVFDAD